MTTIIYLWLLFSKPTDRLICSMWLSRPPTAADLISACGDVTFGNSWVWRGVDIYSGKVACERPASELPEIGCPLHPLSSYRIDVLILNIQYSPCTIQLDHPGTPTQADIAAQCPGAPAQYDLRFGGTRAQEPDPLPACPMPKLVTGPALTDLPETVEAMATSRSYVLLAGRLIWYGLVRPDCSGWSGIDPLTGAATGCGMDAAKPAVVKWQNQFDADLYQAGARTNVPPRLLKAVIGQESQFWPLWSGPNGETGMIQLTDDGADTALHYSLELFAEFCPQSIYPERCTRTYDTLTAAEKSAIRDTLRASLLVTGQPLDAAWYVGDDFITYARILAAYYCLAGELGDVPSWDNTLAIYHSGGGCLQAGMLCEDGLIYLRKIK